MFHQARKLLTSSALILTVLSGAQATTIAIGTLASITDTSNMANIAWTYGQSQCTFEFLSYGGQNPCTQQFALTDGEEGFQLAGCGGPLWMTEWGNWYSNCYESVVKLGTCWDPNVLGNSGIVTQTYVCG
jgi:hypothetical protein